MAAQSPTSSPRLPSPPPMAEDQISPSASSDNDVNHNPLHLTNDVSSSRRIHPGSKSADMHEGPPLVPLADIDSAFQLTEHLKALHETYTHPPDAPDTAFPVDKETARALAQPPPGVDGGIWLYELCRFLTLKANLMVVGLFTDTPPCDASSCPEMRASEWQYLCAAHEPPKSCCAIDYCCHTLDWCATSLTSTKLFPSRLALGTTAAGGAGGGGETASSQTQLRKMTEVFRRVYRIFAHAWFAHREAFWRVEAKTGLYVFFKTVCDEFRLIPEDNYTIPPEAEGIEATPTSAPHHTLPSIMSRSPYQPWGTYGDQQEHEEEPAEQDDSAPAEPAEPEEPAVATTAAAVAGNITLATGNTTKRHRHTMSHDRSASISTVIHEEIEEDDDGDDDRPAHLAPEHEVQSTGVVELLEPEGDTASGNGHKQETHGEPPPFTEGARPPSYEEAAPATTEPEATEQGEEKQNTEEATSLHTSEQHTAAAPSDPASNPQIPLESLVLTEDPPSTSSATEEATEPAEKEQGDEKVPESSGSSRADTAAAPETSTTALGVGSSGKAAEEKKEQVEEEEEEEEEELKKEAQDTESEASTAPSSTADYSKAAAHDDNSVTEGEEDAAVDAKQEKAQDDAHDEPAAADPEAAGKTVAD